MGLRINQNIAAQNAYRNLSVTDGQMSKSLEKLSSGFRINRAADDAAGLSISEGLRSQIGGLKVAVRNAQDGINVVQTADGALNESTAILQRMRDLAVQSANGSNDSNSRGAINEEAKALKSELNRISDKTTFNNVNLLDGSFAKDFQVGYQGGDTINVAVASGGAAVTASGATKASTTSSAASALNQDFSAAGNALVVKYKVDGGAEQTFTYSTDQSAAADSDAAGTAIATALGAASGLDATYDAATQSFTLTSAGTNDGATSTLEITSVDNGASGAASGLTTGTSTGAEAIAASNKDSFGAGGLGLNSVDLSTQSGATSAIASIDSAIKTVSTARGKLGALQNRFEHTVNNLNVTVENLSASESQIRDTDMAQEMTQFTRAQILQQAGTSMLAQANSSQQSVLKLLG
ncbi:flagellin [Angustibacter sp. Root456]|uniref:flagellin N-terminal helical domain-containing protein n=1 Tax=Angustibacter sp. Root456 TaxID=1736539 RepID=UPI0007016A61|nr:flagellin [Angustibacter sp. Root456]KQX69528.1 flagellin [Angustibacter sp. Root456]